MASSDSTQLLRSQAKRLQENLDIKNRKYHFKTYRSCFEGSDAVPVIIKLQLAQNEADAIAFGNQLIDAKIITHVTGNHRFEKKKYFYKFLNPSNDADDEKEFELRRAFTVKDTFKLLDNDGDGTISFGELKQAMIACDMQVSDQEIHRMLRERGFSDPANVALDYTAYVDLLGGKSLRLSISELYAYFHALDLDGSGYLTAAELRHVMTNMNIKCDDGEVDEMVAMYDEDGNGRVQVEEFITLVKSFGVEVYDDLVCADGVPEEDRKLDAVPEKAEQEESAAGQIQISGLPAEVQAALKHFDFTNSGVVSSKGLQRAAELLKVEAMAGVKDPESNPALHWAQGRQKRGLGKVIYKANHIALIVKDVGRSATFYSNVMGFQQIRRPNFDRHGAWFTMGNLELHLIKGVPLVHSGDDLIVGHISIETFDIEKVPGMLRQMGVPFRQNVSVPKGKDSGGGIGTNAANNNDMIVRQYFFRDPDGYYIEVCNCDVLTKYCLGAKNAPELLSYEEGARNLSIEDAGKLIGIMQRWTAKGQQEKHDRQALLEKAKATDHSLKALAGLFGYKAATTVDEALLATLITRKSVWGDICQSMTEDQLREVLLLCGNSVPHADNVMKLKAEVEGQRRMQAPAFYEDGNVLTKPKPSTLDDDM
mmetsp:Transcript_42714/g.70474  ORF Transcript_42714/g.70474 Transcript_42714/m.70474 type:complete len:651 (-) Transcript_42714:246-2198(-)